MKTKDEFLAIIEQVVQNLGNTIRGRGKFLSNDDVGVFWETIRTECGLRMVSFSSFDVDAFFRILSSYTQVRKRKGYDCACKIAESVFKACDSSTIAVIFKTPFDAYFKQTQQQNFSPFGNGYSIRHTLIHDFAKASAEIISSLSAVMEVASDLEKQIFDLLMKHRGKQNDQDLAEAIVKDLKEIFHADP